MTDEPRFEELGDVEDLSDDDGSDEEFWEPFRLEPEGATRNSPHAIAALVVAALSAFPLLQGYVYFGLFFPDFGPLNAPRLFRVILGLLPTVGFAIGAWWLAGRADEEIYVAEGRLGGVGFARGARIVAVLAAVGLVAVTALNLFVRTDRPDFPAQSGIFEVPDSKAVEFNAS